MQTYFIFLSRSSLQISDWFTSKLLVEVNPFQAKRLLVYFTRHHYHYLAVKNYVWGKGKICSDYVCHYNFTLNKDSIDTHAQWRMKYKTMLHWHIICFLAILRSPSLVTTIPCQMLFSCDFPWSSQRISFALKNMLSKHLILCETFPFRLTFVVVAVFIRYTQPFCKSSA